MDWATVEAFDANIHYEPNSGCWLWVGADNGVGYGKFRGDYAHRISYARHKGPIPDGLHLDHLCRVRCCVNPDHLEPVTNAENARRGMAGHHMKNGQAPVGSKSAASKISECDVIAIRSEYAGGLSQYAIAARHAISQPTVSQIVRRVTWGHV